MPILRAILVATLIVDTIMRIMERSDRKKYYKERRKNMIIFKTNAYKRKDGFYMIYVNAYNIQNKGKISVGIGENVAKSKLTKGQSRLINAFLDNFKNVTPVIEDFVDNGHPITLKNDLAFGITLYVTDIANIGGNIVDRDGAYIEYDGSLYHIEDLKGEY